MVVTIGLNWQQELYVYLYIYTVHICRYDQICMLTQAGWNHRHMFVSGYLLPPFRKLSNLSLHATVQQSLTRRKEDISWSFDVSLILKLWRKQYAVVTPEGFWTSFKIQDQATAIHGPHQCRISEVLTDKVHQLGLFWKWLAPDMTKMTKCQQSTAQVCVGLCVCVFFFAFNILLLENSHPGFQCPNLDHGTDSFIWVLEVIALCDPCGPYDMHNRRIKLPHGPWVLASTCN